jgi:hypothetical protein
MRGVFRRLLVGGVACSLLLPIVLAVVCGLGVLLGSLGDEAGRIVCGRAALVVGVFWLTAVIATAVVGGIAVLDAEPPRSRRGRRPPRRDGQDGREPVHGD